MSTNRFDLPDLGLGLGLRAPNLAHILSDRPAVGFFEIISENYLRTGGRPLQNLDRVLEHYPIVMHGVSLSIGSTDALDRSYLRELKQLAHHAGARWISDHLCWTGVLGVNTHDLLPLPLTEESLQHIVCKVRQVQDFLECPILIENPSSYVQFTADAMPEWEFLTRLAEGADCGLLLDVNNVYVSARNHGYDPRVYIDAVPADRIMQVHLAGHTDHGTHVIDTHDGPVIDPVWRLYARLMERTGPVSTMIEWDANIPPFAVVQQEIAKAAPLRHRGVRDAVAQK